MENKDYVQLTKDIKNYKIARMNVLCMLLLTVVSIMLILISDRYFLFSIYISNSLVATGSLLKLDYGTSIMVVMVILALIIVGVYFLFWLLSKKRRWAMIVLLVLVSIDSVILLLDFNVQLIVDILFHVWVLYYFILGVKSSARLQKMPQGVAITHAELNDMYRRENGIDPLTGQPVAGMQVPPAAQPVGYDPMTGAPIYANPASAPAKFDPMTGEPIAEQPVAAETGETAPEAPETTEDSETALAEEETTEEMTEETKSE